MEPKKRHNAEIVLACLLDGYELECLIDKQKISLQKDKEGNKVLCTTVKKYPISEEDSAEEYYLPVEISLSYFIKLCEGMPESQRISLIGNRVLTSLKRKK